MYVCMHCMHAFFEHYVCYHRNYGRTGLIMTIRVFRLLCNLVITSSLYGGTTNCRLFALETTQNRSIYISLGEHNSSAGGLFRVGRFRLASLSSCFSPAPSRNHLCTRSKKPVRQRAVGLMVSG